MIRKRMVTGNNLTELKSLEKEFFDLTYSDEPASNYILLLEFGSSELKACWYHKAKNLVTGFATYPLDNKSVAASIEKIAASHTYLFSDFDQYLISVCSDNYQCTPISMGIGNEEQSFTLSNNFDSKNELLNSYELVGERLKIQYVIANELQKAIEKTFPKHALVPHIAPRVEKSKLDLKKSIAEDLVVVHIEETQIDIIAFKGRKLQLCNSFFQTGKEDIAYYILYCVEVLGLNPEKVELRLSGKIEIGDDKWNVLNAYWKRLSIESALDQIEISDQLHNRDKAEFDYLTQTLLCE